jgi:glycosyltransferase involved in cell wall biosynthesis
MLFWIFQTGEPLPSDDGKPRPMRAINLSEALVKRGHRVEIWSSAFFHQERRHRVKKFTSLHLNDQLTIHLIPSCGYTKNLSIRRLADHAQLGFRLRKILNNYKGDLPDLAFIGYPPIELAFFAGKWCKKEEIPFVLDVKDQWPEIFIRALPSKIESIARFFLWPYFFMGSWLIYQATSLCSMTPEFLGWAKSFSKRGDNDNDFAFPLTPASSEVDKNELLESDRWVLDLKIKSNSKTRVIFFVGNFMQSAFDFRPIIVAAEKAWLSGNNWKFVLCGDGETWDHVKKSTSRLGNVIMPGRVDKLQMISLAKISDIAVAPIKNNPDFLMSIPNKIVDYFSLGLPVLTSLKGVVSKLLETHDAGGCYQEGDNESLYILLSEYLNDMSLLAQKSQNAKKVHKKLFNGNKVYSNAAVRLEGIASKVANASFDNKC